MKFTIEMRAGVGLNDRMHWAQRAKKVKQHRHATGWALKAAHAVRPPLPVVVTLTRCTAGRIAMDKDNLQGSLKAVRDELAVFLGVDDSDERVEWKYEQRLGVAWAVEVQIEEVTHG